MKATFLIENREGIVVPKPYGNRILNGFQESIVLHEFNRKMSGVPIYLIQDGLAIALVKLSPPNRIDEEEFLKFQNKHRMSLTEKRVLFPGKVVTFMYDVQVLHVPESPKEVRIPKGTNNYYVKDLKFVSREFQESSMFEPLMNEDIKMIENDDFQDFREVSVERIPNGNFIQIHKSDEVKVFNNRKEDITDEIKEFKDSIMDIEGEFIFDAWKTEDKILVSDVLYLNESLTSKRLKTRQDKLSDIIFNSKVRQNPYLNVSREEKLEDAISTFSQLPDTDSILIKQLNSRYSTSANSDNWAIYKGVE